MNEVLTLIENVTTAPEGTGGIILFFAAIIFISFVSPRAGFAITKFFIWAMASLVIGILAGFAVGRRM